MMYSDCRDLERFYSGFRKSTAKSLCEFEKSFVTFSFYITGYVYEVSILSILINILHLFILTRKSMRTSSINILMAAVALFDIFASLVHIQLFLEQYSYLIFKCFPTDTYGLVLTRTLLIVVKDFSRRCSTWLIVFIALIRTLIIRNPLSPKHILLGKPKASLIVIAGICAANLPISIFKFFEIQFVFVTISKHHCAPEGSYYFIASSELFLRDNGFLAKYFNFFNSFMSDMIPCILLPIVTCLLVMDLLKTRKKCRARISAKNNNSRGKTGLVFCVAIMFFIVEFPFGLSVGSAWLFMSSPGVQNILNFFGYMFTVLISVNACTHLIVCLIVSSQYRSTAISVLSCGYISQRAKVERRTQAFSSTQTT
ncbi:G-protein coupled receptors family 1 profile domain-containing protein [Caenorhabditis elegans]|uniref:G-protein coupled receptors family 1 profile domain-containing protein n=1 Tax=Caenorhabditis elegans TaxID=6239 RepID=P91160_CAEEL|nr:G-protein coupled receptors family 1 profile domain-containing protein [Caenorhabditis elegans]CCD67245.2 G-protein coupled receptors family 1 profile domain-containing protein [Caenorhabditis elegans]|eukprot:NP_503810.2 Serpentine Receptor, class W [Caenorhabditis elegans]